jgi:hypothetical protein
LKAGPEGGPQACYRFTPPLPTSDIERILAAQAADTEKILAVIAALRQEAANVGKTLLPQLIAALAKRPG